MTRTAREVFEDHLKLSEAYEVEQDIERNWSKDVVILTNRGVFHGHDGIRQLARMLEDELPNPRFHNRLVLLEGEVAFLEWTAESDRFDVRDGVDSYVIRDGKFVAQTIHYTLAPPSRVA
jgi:hypothetical protein